MIRTQCLRFVVLLQKQFIIISLVSMWVKASIHSSHSRNAYFYTHFVDLLVTAFSMKTKQVYLHFLFISVLFL